MFKLLRFSPLPSGAIPTYGTFRDNSLSHKTWWGQKGAETRVWHDVLAGKVGLLKLACIYLLERVACSKYLCPIALLKKTVDSMANI